MVAKISPLIVIVGETASGKTAAAIELAKKFSGEIICADSRTVYRGMDIGTAKPSAEEQSRVPHHVINVVEPNELFTAADFKRLANEAIEDIYARGKIPIMVGGTGLYVDSVLFDFQFRPKADPELRKKLEAMTVIELQEEVRNLGLMMPENDKNPRHLMRAIEAGEVIRQPKEMRPNTLVIGITLPREVLKERIVSRVEQMVEHGFTDEVKKLIERYGKDSEALQAPGYRAFSEYLDGTVTIEEAKANFVRNDLQLAKRQRTWFKRNKSTHWLAHPSNIVDLATTFLNKTT
ncbi:MAG: miaA [Candidatus Saccharibacteria bacterium]|nr:miaA [Candidatus Saccharibacteria bacterium]